jgi:hypothetical protein
MARNRRGWRVKKQKQKKYRHYFPSAIDKAYSASLQNIDGLKLPLSASGLFR